MVSNEKWTRTSEFIRDNNLSLHWHRIAGIEERESEYHILVDDLCRSETTISRLCKIAAMKRKIEHIPNMTVIGNAFTCKDNVHRQSVTCVLTFLYNSCQHKTIIVGRGNDSLHCKAPHKQISWVVCGRNSWLCFLLPQECTEISSSWLMARICQHMPRRCRNQEAGENLQLICCLLSQKMSALGSVWTLSANRH